MSIREADQQLMSIINAMRKAGDPQHAAGAKAYMKSDRSFYGLKKAQIEDFAATFLHTQPSLEVDELIAIVDRLWVSDNFDEVTFGVVLARRCRRLFNTQHLADPFRRWFDTCEGWSHCDELATRCAGEILHRDMDAGLPIINRWRESPHLWTRRASILCHFPAIRACDANLDALFTTFDTLLDNEDFFIRKAIGWTLREMTRKDYQQQAIDYMLANRDRAARLTLREGARHLPGDVRDRVLG